MRSAARDRCLPAACGPLSGSAIEALATGRTENLPTVPADTDPLGRDLQLALETEFDYRCVAFGKEIVVVAKVRQYLRMNKQGRFALQRVGLLQRLQLCIQVFE